MTPNQSQSRANAIKIFSAIAILTVSFVVFASSSNYSESNAAGFSDPQAAVSDSEWTSLSASDASPAGTPEALPEPQPPVVSPGTTEQTQPQEPALTENLFEAPPAVKCAYLTFDDGPSENTPRILDILDEYGVKATFFVCATGYSGYYKDIVDRGHTIALHATNHDYKVCYASEEAYFNDLYNLQAAVEAATGVHCRIMRFPGGSSNTVSQKYSKGLMKRLVAEVTERGFIYHDWNVDSEDATKTNLSTQTIINNIYSGFQKLDIIDVLMHDTGSNRNTTVEALPHVISMLMESGYVILPITESTEPIQHFLK